MTASLTPSVPGVSNSTLAIILILVAIYLTVRMYRNLKGTKFNESKVYRLPLIYLTLTIISLFTISPSLTDIIVVIIAIAIGYFIGLRLGAGLQFFEKEGATHYRRAPLILILWMVSFVLRFAIELFYPTNLVLGLATEILLAGTTGMILGEAVHIVRSHKNYKKSD